MTELGTVKNWMTRDVITVKTDTSVMEADRMMREYGIRRLPVINQHNKLVGIVTKGDIREASPSDATSLSVWEVHYLINKLKIRDTMTKVVTTVTPDTGIIDAAEIMLNQKISGLPVLDENASLLGIITESDIFRMLVKNRAVLATL